MESSAHLSKEIYKEISMTLIRTLTILVFSAFIVACEEERAADCKKIESTGVAQFSVQEMTGGYSFVLPSALLAGFPKAAEYEITLTSTEGKGSTVAGKGTVSGKNVLEFVTPEVFDLESILRNKLDSIDIVQRGRNADSNCSGCSRGPMWIFGDDSICYCIHEDMGPRDENNLDPTTQPIT